MMKISRRIADWLRELEIRWLMGVVSDPTIPFAIRMACWEDARALIARRSPEQIARMERAKGLV